jgi:dolichol-phosphate mannosyltransferase
VHSCLWKPARETSAFRYAIARRWLWEIALHREVERDGETFTAAPGLYAGHRVLAMFPFFNEEGKLPRLLAAMSSDQVDEYLGVNDGSTDNGPAVLAARGIHFIDQKRHGVGSCIKAAIRYARENNFDILVVMAGNAKDDPAQIPDLLRPILENRADYVQGSRYLPGGSSPNLPLFRHFAIRALSIFFRLYTGKICTDLTNGFRAYRLDILDNPRIDLNQSWLDGYEFEYYVHWKAVECGYRVVEVPVTKTYPTGGVSYTKVVPFLGWWHMLRPFLLLSLRLRK